MKLRFVIAILAFAALPLMAAANPSAPNIVTPDQVKWAAGTGPFKGVEVAVIDGDPAKAGPFVMRLRIPDGAKFGAHFHNDTERVTVISGTLVVGVGDKMVESSMVTLPAGSFVAIPSGVHHYAMAKGVTVIQIAGNGPFGMTAVDAGK